MRHAHRPLAVAAVALLLAACSGGGDTSTPTTTTASTTTGGAPAASTTATPGETTTSAPAPPATVIPAALWGLSADGRIVHIDPESLATVEEFALATSGEVFGSIVAAGADLIASVITRDGDVITYDVYRFAPGTAPEKVDVAGKPCCPAAAFGEVWLADAETGALTRIDPATGAVVATATVDAPARTLAAGADAVYAGLPEAGVMVRLDAAGAEQARVNVAELYTEPIVSGGSVWIANSEGVGSLDATTLEPGFGFTDINASDIESAAGVLWATANHALNRLDAATGQVGVWGEVTDARQVFADGDTLYVTDAQGQVSVGSTLEAGLTLLGTPDAEFRQLSFVPAHGSDGAPIAPQQPEVPAPTEFAVPVGVRWDEVALPSDADRSAAHRVVATSEGYVVLGTESQFRGGRAAIWTSAEGAEFTKANTADLTPPNSFIRLADAAANNGILVAVGSKGSSCEQYQPPQNVWATPCYRSDAISWASTDGTTWTPGGATDGSFEIGEMTSISQVLPYGDGFVATGRLIRARTDWNVAIWTSADGLAWTKVAELSDPAGLISNPSIAAAGDALMLVADVVRCDTPTDQVNGYGFANPPRNGRAFTSTDAVTWTAVDLVAAGLADDSGPETCDDDQSTPQMGGGGVSAGAVTPLGGDSGMLWTGSTGMFLSTDGTTWDALPAAPQTVSGASTHADYLGAGIAGTSTTDLLQVALGAVDRGQQPFLAATWDGTSWTDWSYRASSVPAFSDPIGVVSPFPGLNDLAKGAVAALLVGAGGDPNAAHAVAFVSRATTVEPDVEVTCTPAPEANCAGAGLRELDLSGADLHGIDFTGALLEGVDLRGANLTGAKFDDSELVRVDLTDSTLTGATMQRMDASLLSVFDGADMSGTNLTDAQLGSAVGTNLRGATLVDARATIEDFSGADLRDAQLTGTGFTQVDLTGALFAGAVLDDVTWWASTCPDGVTQGADLEANCEGHFID